MTGAVFIPAASPEAQLRGEEIQLLRQLLRRQFPRLQMRADATPEDIAAGKLSLEMSYWPAGVMITHSETVAIMDRLEAKGEAHFWADADHKLWGEITARGAKVVAEYSLRAVLRQFEGKTVTPEIVADVETAIRAWALKGGV